MSAPYLGDFSSAATVSFYWPTYDSGGASITRATDGTVAVYQNGNVDQTSAGVTDTEDFDSLTGIHYCAVDCSASGFYATGSDYTVVLSGAVIDGQTVNATLAQFSIENRITSTLTSADVSAAASQSLTDFGVSTLVANDISAGADSAIGGRFTFTNTSAVDANIYYINNASVGGSGTTAAPWTGI